LADNWAEQNVESLELQPLSILSLYRRLLALVETIGLCALADTKP
jgi:hypothetical protein